MLVILTSDEPWGNVWHTQLHYAFQLSKRCLVYYIDPPRKWRFRNLFFWKLQIRKENENLFIVTYHNVFPVSFLSAFFGRINDLVNSFLIKNELSVQEEKIILWRFTYYRCLHCHFLDEMSTIYHVVDQYMGAENDKLLALKSDLVISTSPKFLEYYGKLNENVINVPQAVSNEEMVCDETLVGRIKTEFGKIILFIGTITWDTNLEIFKKTSEAFPDYILLIIGPNLLSDEAEIKQFQEIINKQNVKYLGTIPAMKLKNYVKASEICIIPYRFSYEKEMTVRSPLKAISYIAQKKIVITSIDCEIEELENKFIYKAESTEEFILLIEKAINKQLNADVKAANDFLERISYDRQIDFIFSKLQP